MTGASIPGGVITVFASQTPQGGGMETGYIGNTGAKTTGAHLHVGYYTSQYDENTKSLIKNISDPSNYFSGLSNITVTPYAQVTSGLQNITSTKDTLKLEHVMNYYNYVNNTSLNWNKNTFSSFYNSYYPIMDSSALTAATIMHLYKPNR